MQSLPSVLRTRSRRYSDEEKVQKEEDEEAKSFICGRPKGFPEIMTVQDLGLDRLAVKD